MEFDSEKIREQLRHYGEVASSFAKMDTKDLEAQLKEFIQTKSQNFDTAALIETVRDRTKKGVDTVSELIRTEFRQEFEEVAHKGRTEFAQFIEKIVCLIEERFGTPASHQEDEKAWRKEHGAEKKVGPKSEATKKSSGKKSSKKDGKKSSSKTKDED